MSQKIKVDRMLEFRDSAATNLNVLGTMNPLQVMTEYNYGEVSVDAARMTAYLDTDSLIALSVQGATFTTIAGDTDICSESYGSLALLCARNPIIEAKFKIDDITNVGINFGFADATAYGTGVLPFRVTTDSVTDATIANGAMFAFGSDATTKRWFRVWDSGGTQSGAVLASGIAPVNNTYRTLRISLDSSANARYYFDGVQVGYRAAACATATPLVPYLAIRNLSASIHILTVRYVRVWQDA